MSHLTFTPNTDKSHSFLNKEHTKCVLSHTNSKIIEGTKQGAIGGVILLPATGPQSAAMATLSGAVGGAAKGILEGLEKCSKDEPEKKTFPACCIVDSKPPLLPCENPSNSSLTIPVGFEQIDLFPKKGKA